MTILSEAADRLELSHLIPYDSLDRWKCELCGFIGKTSGKFTHSDACLITRLRASSQPMADSGWRTIETAPRDGTRIIVSGLRSGIGPARHHAVVRWTNECNDGFLWLADGDLGESYGYLTHWQPLPPPPGETPAPQTMPEGLHAAIRAILDRWAFNSGQLDTLMAEISAAYSKRGE